MTDNYGNTASSTLNVTVNAQTVTSTSTKTVVVLGSSTSYGTGITPTSDAYVNRFTNYLTTLFPGSTVVNLGTPAYTTYNAMPTGYTPPGGRPSPDTNKNITKALSYNPMAIIVNFPTNDAANDYTLTEQQNNFQTIVSAANTAGVPI